MKDGSTHLAFKPEHAVDLDTGVVVAALIHSAEAGDTATLGPTLEEAQKNLSAVGLAPTSEYPCDLVADKGYHSRDGLKGLDGGPWKTRIAEPKPAKGYLRWHGDDEARAAVYGNRGRLKSGVGKQAMRKRGEMVERSFAHILDRGGMRRALAARPRERPQALSGPCRGVQPRHSDAGRVRKGNREGGRERQERDLVLHLVRFCAGDRRHLGHRRRNGNARHHHRA